METLRPLLEPSMGEKQWNLVKMLSQAITDDKELFNDINNPFYTLKFINDIGITDLKT